MPDRQERIEEICRASIELDPDSRASFIAEACAGDREMKTAIEERIAQYERAKAYFTGLAQRIGFEGLGSPRFTVIEGQAFCKYRVEYQIGEGGMGIVYLATDTQLNRPVALKFLSPRFMNDERVKILDFGLAKLREASMITKTGTTMGTVAYMSPEQARGEEVDHRSDLWSLGVMLYEMMYGRLPFRGDYEHAVIYSILHDEPASGDAIMQLPEHCGRVIRRALAKEPNDRYQTVDAMKDALQMPSFTEGMEWLKLPRKTNLLPYVLASLGLIVLIALVVWFLSFIVEAPTVIDSIAVLPIENLTSDPEQEYLADGMTDALITRLGQIQTLKVIAHSSIIQFKDTDKTPPEIAGELGVGALVEATVDSKNDSLLISVRLLDAPTGHLLWTNTYGRPGDGFFSAMNLITKSISEEIAAVLTLSEATQLAVESRIDPEAMKWYLRGKHHYARLEFFVSGSLERADSALTRAVSLDTTFADAYGLLARVRLTQARIGGNPEEVGKMAQKALSLNPTQPDASAMMAWYTIISTWDWQKGKDIYLQAIEANPNNAALRREFAMYYYKINRPAEGVQEMHKAVELDPLSFWAISFLADGYYRLEDYDTAIKIDKELVNFAPDTRASYYMLGKHATKAGEDSIAAAAFEKIVDMGESIGYRGALYYWKQGMKERYEDFFSNIELNGGAEQKAAYYSDTGDIENGIYWLERDLEQRPWRHEELLFYDHYDNLHADPRFRALLRKANLLQFLNE